jgi:hypothetical protein
MENLYAENVLENSESTRAFEGIYELNLNLVDKLDRDADPGLAMIADFYYLANNPSAFKNAINKIMDSTIKANAEKLAAEVKKHMDDANTAKKVIDATDKLGKYIVFNSEEVKKVVSLSACIEEKEQVIASKDQKLTETQKNREEDMKLVLELVRDAYETGQDVKRLEKKYGMPEWLLKKFKGKTVDETYDIYLGFVFTEAQNMLIKGDSIDAAAKKTRLSKEAVGLAKDKIASKLDDELLEELKRVAW